MQCATCASRGKSVEIMVNYTLASQRLVQSSATIDYLVSAARMLTFTDLILTMFELRRATGSVVFSERERT